MFRRKTTVLVSFLIVAATFLLIFLRSNFFSPVKSQIVESIAPTLNVLSFPLREFKKILFYHRTFDEYLELRRQVNSLKAKIAGTQELARENQRLMQLLNLKQNQEHASLAASVIARDPSNWNATLIIDKGKKDGVEVGMPVVGASGVVGKIAEASAQTSKVILLTDPNFSVVATTERSRESGLVSGTLRGLCRMTYLSMDVGVEIGDEVITSRLSSSFPEGLLVGEVVSVAVNENNQTLDCILQPAVRFSQLEEVLVILRR